MVIGATLLLALGAAALGTLVWWVAGRLGAYAWVALLLGLAVFGFILLAGPIKIG